MYITNPVKILFNSQFEAADNTVSVIIIKSIKLIKFLVAVFK